MQLHMRRTRWMSKVALVAVAGLIAVSALLYPAPAQAHCDSTNGPVVEAARQALAKDDVDLILPYVKADAEAELTAAFDHARAVRKLGPDARELADTFFFETAVRLHRMGEGAAYTGLKQDVEFGPALESAEAAVVSGELDEVYAVLDEAIRHEVGAKYAAIETARAHAEEEQTVAAQRERVEAELIFQTYVYDLYTAIAGNSGHAEVAAETAPAEAAHSH
jgi:hypothetical protein